MYIYIYICMHTYILYIYIHIYIYINIYIYIYIVTTISDVQYSQTDENLNLRQKTSKKIFPKLEFLKAVSVTMIANSEKMKIKKSSHLPYDLCISSPLPLYFFPQIF